MNPRPPQSPRSLDAEERALAMGLPRLHGRTAPGPDLDARILAAAQAAVRPPSRRRPQVRWIAPTALAASVMLAVGMAWQLRPLPAFDAGQPTATARSESAKSGDMPAARMIEPPSAVPPLPIEQDPMAPAPSTLPAPEPVASPATPMREPAPTLQAMSPPPPPSAPPTPVSTAPQAAAAPVMPQTSERAANAGMAKSSTSTDAMMRDAATAASAKARAAEGARRTDSEAARLQPVPADARNEAVMAAEAGFVDDPDEDVPPATANSPAVRNAWLQRITQLQQQGQVDEAKASLAEFRRRYPDAVLPPALQKLETSLDASTRPTHPPSPAEPSPR